MSSYHAFASQGSWVLGYGPATPLSIAMWQYSKFESLAIANIGTQYALWL